MKHARNRTSTWIEPKHGHMLLSSRGMKLVFNGRKTGISVYKKLKDLSRRQINFNQEHNDYEYDSVKWGLLGKSINKTNRAPLGKSRL